MWCAVTAIFLITACRSRNPGPREAPPATAPAVVQPTEFGAAARGLRFGIAAERARFAVGERIQLSAAARNAGEAALTLRLPASKPEVTFRQDLITLEYALDDSRRVTIAPGQAWSGALSGALTLAPGRYRLRVVISAPEPSAAQANADALLWHGEARSNELSVEVAAPAR
jgi:hypothetical protein